MATKPSIKPKLPKRTAQLSDQNTEAAVTEALPESIARRQQKGLLDLMDNLKWDDGFDYKSERSRD